MRAIAIDGPAVAGKTTTARYLSAELGYVYCDTGAIYRALAVGFSERGLTESSTVAEFEAVLPHLSVSLETGKGEEQRMFVNGKDVTSRLRSEFISSLSSVSSAIPSVRAHLKELQRTLALHNNVVMEGRDIGTVILPHADLKVFLTAEPYERARRRHLELVKMGTDISYEEVLRDLTERDVRDSTRASAPLKPAPDAIKVDNTDMSVKETVRTIINLFKENREV